MQQTAARLNWGCGLQPKAGWINADQIDAPGIDVRGDIRNGLPLESDSLDYVVSIHALQELPYFEIVPVLRELRRVLRPGGVLRLSLPDMDRAIDAYVKGNADYFYVKDDEARCLAGRFSIQLTWYGASRIMLSWEFIHELLGRAEFDRITRCSFRETASAFPGIVELDDRPKDSFFVEATK